jgi:dUTP pyrophosphatase
MNEKPILKVKLLDSRSKMPTRSRETDAGYDIFALEDLTLDVNTFHKVNTGIALEIPKGYYGQIFDRSGMACQGFKVSGGVIDENYRGEVGVVIGRFISDFAYLTNGEGGQFSIKSGQKIAQIVFLRYGDFDIEEADSLDDTDRGDLGFGSSGNF